MILALGVAGTARSASPGGAKKPELSLAASPAVAFVPAKFQFIAALRGGDEDYEDYYCPAVEWDWDDDTVSQSSPDCDPYQPGESRIQRRYTAQHVYENEGSYEVKFRLKRKDKVLVAATTTVQVRMGH